jgi:hypothetical protein
MTSSRRPSTQQQPQQQQPQQQQPQQQQPQQQQPQQQQPQQQQQQQGLPQKEDEDEEQKARMVFFDEDETKDGFSDHEIDKPLTWRGDPKETLSDWTVVVCYYDGGDDVEQTFHVHKSILGASQRKSSWFASLFRSQTASANADSLSRITFDVPVIEHFATALDFMYFGTLSIDTTNAVALRFLANYFAIRSLMAAANEYIKNDLNGDTAVDYVLEASKLKDIRLVSGAKLACCKLFSEIDKAAFEALPPPLFEAIICSPDLKPTNLYDVSLTISNYLYANPESLSDRFLYALTDEHIMTEVDPYSARVFLNAIRRLEKDGHRTKNGIDEGNNWDQTKSLSLRCARVLALEWRSMLPLDLQDEYIQLWRKESRASSLVLVSLLASAVDRAQLEVEELEMGLGQGVSKTHEDMNALQKSVEEQDDIILTLRRELQEKESDLQRLSANNQEKDTVIAEKQKAIQELKRIRVGKEEELNRTKNEIREKIHEKDRLLLEAHGALEDKDAEIKRLQGVITEKDIIIREKQKIIGELKVSMDRIKANNAATASTGMFTRRAFNFGAPTTGSTGTGTGSEV